MAAPPEFTPGEEQALEPPGRVARQGLAPRPLRSVPRRRDEFLQSIHSVGQRVDLDLGDADIGEAADGVDDLPGRTL